MATAVILPNTVNGDQTVVGNQNVGGAGNAASYYNAPQYRMGTAPNGANGPCLAVSGNNTFGAGISYISPAGAFSGQTGYLTYNRVQRVINSATGSVVNTYDNGGILQVNYAGTCTISMPAINAAALTTGTLGLEVSIFAANTSTAITLTLGNAADVFFLAGSGYGTAGSGTLSCAANSFGSVTIACSTAGVWYARVLGNWTKT